ncbi:hypothetical protein ACRCJW_02015 [Aerococcus urinaeequi]|uniref:hypothetical protein n=1 Tax=Aerococcus urinaeequi TaxID=51665 RepID=UPI003D6C6CC8
MKKLIKIDLLIHDECLLYDMSNEEATLLLELLILDLKQTNPIYIVLNLIHQVGMRKLEVGV